MTATTPADARWARALAVALVTAPGVLLAQVLVTGAAPALRETLAVCAVVAAVACAVRTRTAVGTAALAAIAQLAGHAVLAVLAPSTPDTRGCFGVVGRGADLGVRYALVRADSCPPGTVGATPALAAVVGAVAAAALVLLAHAALAGLTGALVTALAAGVEVVRSLSGAVLPLLVLLRTVRPVPATGPLPPLPAPGVLVDRWEPSRTLRRGPPAFSAA